MRLLNQLPQLFLIESAVVALVLVSAACVARGEGGRIVFDKESAIPELISHGKLFPQQPFYRHPEDNDARDEKLAEALIVELSKEELWRDSLSAIDASAGAAVRDVVVIQDRQGKSRQHTPAFDRAIASALTKKLSQEGQFTFLECLVCYQPREIELTRSRLLIKNHSAINTFYERLKAEDKVDALVKWSFSSLGGEAVLDVRIINLENVVVWHESLRISAKEYELEREQEYIKRRFPYGEGFYKVGLGLKKQKVRRRGTDTVSAAESSNLAAFSVGYSGLVPRYSSIVYYVGSRFQINAEGLNEFNYFAWGVDLRAGYASSPDVPGGFALYILFAQDFAVAPGYSAGLVVEWDVSDSYYFELGFERPFDKERASNGGNTQYTLDSGFWLLAGLKL